MYIRTSELQRLDVVNIEDGRFLGNVCDVDLDPDTGELRFWCWNGRNGVYCAF